RLGPGPGIQLSWRLSSDLPPLPIQLPPQIRSIVRAPRVLIRPQRPLFLPELLGPGLATHGLGPHVLLPHLVQLVAPLLFPQRGPALRLQREVVRVLRAVGDDAALAYDWIEHQLRLGASATAGATRCECEQRRARDQPARGKHVKAPDRAAHLETKVTVAV